MPEPEEKSKILAEGEELTCPRCGGVNIEAIPPVYTETDFLCLDCKLEFSVRQVIYWKE